MAQVVKHLPSKHEAPEFQTPVLPKNKNKKNKKRDKATEMNMSHQG
jgi:hypothetical protein